MSPSFPKNISPGEQPPIERFSRLVQPSRQGRRSTLRPSPINPFHLHYTPAWVGLGLATAALGLIGVRRYGSPAAIGAGLASLLGLAYMTLIEPVRPTLEHVTFQLPQLPPQLDGLRIGQLSDSHLGLPYTARNLAWAVEQMRREQPELLVITGDLAHRHRAIPKLPALLRNLRAPLGIYAVPGNHDYWEGLDDVRAALQLLEIPLLINEHRRLHWNGAELWLIGLDDGYDGRPDLERALHGVPAEAFKILLMHTPDFADQAADYGIALQLSGHSHGGHIRLPHIGPFTRPRLGARYVMGRYQVGLMAVYVSRGLGGAPLRLFCRPEATIITLKRG